LRKKRFELLFFPKISKQKSGQSNQDNFFPHPNQLPKRAIPSELKRHKGLQKKLEQEPDKKYFAYDDESFDYFAILHEYILIFLKRRL